jgi:hypothetical protein
MPVADDDYRKRLAKRQRSLSTGTRGAVNSGSMMGMGLDYFGNRVLGPAIQKAQGDISEIPNIGKSAEGTLMGAIALGSLGNPSNKGVKGAKATIAALQSKPLRAALDAAEEFGTMSFMDEVAGDAGYMAEDAGRFAKPAGEKLLGYLDEKLASGEMDVKAANRFIKALPAYLRGEGPDAVLQFAGGKADDFNRMMTRADDSQFELDMVRSGMAKGVRKYGPPDLMDYLLSEMPKAQSRIKSVLDEWH